jgi:diphthamide synthase (EF-2-diphthine--ammonia ligase)
VARQGGDYEIVGALTTVTDTFSRISIHGVREELLLEQLKAAGLPPTVVSIPYPCSNEIYEREMAAAMQNAMAQGVTHVIFGDLFLQDIREYREQRLKPLGVTPVFPLWHLPTDELARQMISDCVEAYLATVDLKKMPASLAGRRFDRALLRDLPAGVDPCGENGEFHTFVAAGPMMKGRINVAVGECVERDGYAYADLVAA